MEACRGVGAVLIGLAAALSGGLHEPLQALERAVGADRARRVRELEELQRKHQLCTGAVTASMQRKERCSGLLRSALEECEQERVLATQVATGGLAGAFSFSGTHNEVTALEAEQRLQKAMAMQSAAVEEFGHCVEQANEVSETSRAETEKLAEALSFVDFAARWALQSSLGRCAGAWEAAAGALGASAGPLRKGSVEARRSAVPPPTEAQPPPWAGHARLRLAGHEFDAPPRPPPPPPPPPPAEVLNDNIVIDTMFYVVL